MKEEKLPPISLRRNGIFSGLVDKNVEKVEVKLNDFWFVECIGCILLDQGGGLHRRKQNIESTAGLDIMTCRERFMPQINRKDG